MEKNFYKYLDSNGDEIEITPEDLEKLNGDYQQEIEWWYWEQSQNTK